jgi:hypothetical protein
MRKDVPQIEGIRVVQAISRGPGRPPAHLSRLLHQILISPTDLGNLNRQLATIHDLSARLKAAIDLIATLYVRIEGQDEQIQKLWNHVQFLRSRIPR